MIAAIVGAQQGRYNYFAEMETAGKCLEWVKDHLALDEIGIYLENKNISSSQETIYSNLYEYLMTTINQIGPGAGGVIFTPWLHGANAVLSVCRAVESHQQQRTCRLLLSAPKAVLPLLHRAGRRLHYRQPAQRPAASLGLFL